MGAKVQTENTKLNVPGAGSYESPSKVSRAVIATVIFRQIEIRQYMYNSTDRRKLRQVNGCQV